MISGCAIVNMELVKFLIKMFVDDNGFDRLEHVKTAVMTFTQQINMYLGWYVDRLVVYDSDITGNYILSRLPGSIFAIPFPTKIFRYYLSLQIGFTSHKNDDFLISALQQR